MAAKPVTLFNKIFRNQNGKVVVWQSPNSWLWGWIVFSILAKSVEAGNLHRLYYLTGQAFLIVWAYYELRTGASLFRRVLGTAVLVAIVFSYFK